MSNPNSNPNPKAGKNFAPPGTKKLVYFVDDLNMPQLDPYNTQSPIALLRQHFDYGHWYCEPYPEPAYDSYRPHQLA